MPNHTTGAAQKLHVCFIILALNSWSYCVCEMNLIGSYSIGDNCSYLGDNRKPIDKMIGLLAHHFSPVSGNAHQKRGGCNVSVNGFYNKRMPIHRHRRRHRHTDTQTQTQTDTDKQTHTQTQIRTQTRTQTQRHRHKRGHRYRHIHIYV